MCKQLTYDGLPWLHFRRQLLQGDRATVFLLDKSVNELWSAMADGMKEIRIPANAGLAGEF